MTVDCRRRTVDQADRIDAMHTGIGDHHIEMSCPVAYESRIAIMSRGASPDAVVAIDAAVGVNDHRRCAIDDAVIDKKVEQRFVAG